MRIFVTGAPGFIGSALVPELMQAGHQVLGLTRSEEGAEKLRAAGAEVLHGNIEDLESLREGASKTDGVIHLAFNHDFSQFQKNAEAIVGRRRTFPTWRGSIDWPLRRRSRAQSITRSTRRAFR
jgi:nucleoside-diphosphate-sugar epimerase